MNYGMTPLHVLSMNPHAPGDTIAVLLHANIDTSVGLDNTNQAPLEYARDYNVDGLVAMIATLCIHKNATIPVPVQAKTKTKSQTNTKTNESLNTHENIKKSIRTE